MSRNDLAYVLHKHVAIMNGRTRPVVPRDVAYNRPAFNVYVTAMNVEDPFADVPIVQRDPSSKFGELCFRVRRSTEPADEVTWRVDVALGSCTCPLGRDADIYGATTCLHLPIAM
jgi:hypothetical protein